MRWLDDVMPWFHGREKGESQWEVLLDGFTFCICGSHQGRQHPKRRALRKLDIPQRQAPSSPLDALQLVKAGIKDIVISSEQSSFALARP